MGNLLFNLNPIERTERLVDLLELRPDWNGGVFDGCAYEHMLPVFESAYRHLVKPLSRPGEQVERGRLERAIYEVFGKSKRAHSRMMLLVANHVFLGQRIEYPITEWTKDELFNEYDTSFYWSTVWGYVSVGATAVDVTAIVASTVAKIYTAATVLRVAGAAGAISTVAGAAAAYLSYIHFTRERDKIREEVQNRIDKGALEKTEWDIFDLEVKNRYVS